MRKHSKNNLQVEIENWHLLEKVARIVPRIFIWGPPGVGKSYTAYQILRTLNTTVSQCTLDEDKAVQELMGHFIPKGNIFAWHNGPVTTAFKKGHGLVVNELARASSAVKDMFLGILDDPEIAFISLPSGDNIKRGKNFRVIATANNPPDELDEALRDRFDIIMNVKTPHPAIIKSLNKKIAGLGNIVLSSYKDPVRAISPRRASAFTDLLSKKVATEEAALLAFGPRYKDILAILRVKGVRIRK